MSVPREQTLRTLIWIFRMFIWTLWALRGLELEFGVWRVKEIWRMTQRYLKNPHAKFQGDPCAVRLGWVTLSWHHGVLFCVGIIMSFPRAPRGQVQSNSRASPPWGHTPGERLGTGHTPLSDPSLLHRKATPNHTPALPPPATHIRTSDSSSSCSAVKYVEKVCWRFWCLYVKLGKTHRKKDTNQEGNFCEGDLIISLAEEENLKWK